MKTKQDLGVKLYFVTVAHQYSLNEMRRGQLLRAVAKCSLKCLSRANARELTISFLHENRRPAEETTADTETVMNFVRAVPVTSPLARDAWASVQRVGFEQASAGCCLHEAPKGLRTTWTSPVHCCSVVKAEVSGPDETQRAVWLLLPTEWQEAAFGRCELVSLKV